MGSKIGQGLLRRVTVGSVRVSCIAIFLTLSTIFGAVAQDFRSGLSAYRTSDYAAAIAHWRPLARAGHAKSQAALGYMYLQGLGVARNHVQAARWYRRAAAQNQIDALHSLGRMYLRGFGVAKDLERAYVLCEIALAQGEAQGLACRDRARRSMTSAQIEEARHRVSQWQILAEKDWLVY